MNTRWVRVSLLFALVAIVSAAVPRDRIHAARAESASSRPDGSGHYERPATFVKITLGIGDVAGRDWSGRLNVENGTIMAIEPWGFETRHSLDAEKHSWVCDSNVVVARAKTRFAEPQRGIVVGIQGPSSARLSVDTKQGAFAFELADLRPGATLPKLGGAASVGLAMTPRPVAVTESEEDHPAISIDPAGRIWVAYVTWQQGEDTIYARSFDGRAWSEPEALAGPGDFYQVKLAAEQKGRLWAVWAAQEKGNWDLYARVHDRQGWGPVSRLTTAPESDFKQSLATDARGNVWLAWQSFRNGNSDIYLKNLSDPQGGETAVTDHPANDWEPSLACNGQGGVYVAWDTYRNGNYDVYLRRMLPEPGAPVPVAASPEFEAHASAACDPAGRVWIAYDSAQPNWGKDFARGETLCDGNFTATLHAYRRLELRVVTPSGVCAAPKPIPQLLPDSWKDVPEIAYGIVGHRRSYDLPQLSIDAAGNLWLTYRLNRQGYLGHPPGGGVWEVEAVWFDGRKWSDPVFIPDSRGRNGQHLGAALDRAGRLWFAWPTGSHFRQEDCDVYVGSLPSAEPAAPLAAGAALAIPAPAGQDPDLPVHHRWQVGGKGYQVCWGDLHRHTEISLCTPTIDGTLLDAYRYALDSAKLDFLGVTDHTRDVPPYPWWCSQKMADLFSIDGRFAGFYSYERSNPMTKDGGGHRNLWFPERGNKVYGSKIVDKAAPSPAGLYEQLRREHVRCAMGAHTPGWNQKAGEGTWTYNDPEYEPVAEIFQAYRTSYEMPQKPGDHTSADYKRSIWAALERGYRIGLIASSDHWSTHLSYACVYADQLSRESIFEAIQKRRTYAAMDKILLEFSINGHPMGEEFETSGPVDVRAAVVGTADLAKIELVKNNRFIHTVEPHARRCEFTFRDTSAAVGRAPRPTASAETADLQGTSYYYLRVTQESTLPDGSPIMAWSSPIWVNFGGAPKSE